MSRAALVLVAVAAAAGAPRGAARADSPEVCAPTGAIDPLRLLRQASLDVRGRVPGLDEYVAVRDAADPAAAVERAIDGWLDGEAFLEEVRRSHQALLWGSLNEIDSLLPDLRRIFYARGADVWWVANAATIYRGRAGLLCLDQEQTEFDAVGRPVPLEVTADPDCRDGQCRREGWVRVAPYWDPATTIRVCAFDAQAVEVGTNGRPCDRYNPDPACGCGPALRACGTPGQGEVAIRRALVEEPTRIFEWVVRTGRPYHEAFRTRTSFVNGASTHFYRHQAGATREELGGATVYEARMGALPDLGFGDVDRWVEVERDATHAGVLTTAAFLLRFASDRARANQFYTAFLCDPFVPTSEGLPPEEADPSPNLRERAGCADCHAVLEPAAAHWARWRTGGTHGFFDPSVVSFTTPRPDCLRCGEGRYCNPLCQGYFVTPDNAHPTEVERWRGLPLARVWLDDAEVASAEIGPLALTDEPHEQAQLARCAVRTLAARLLGRDLGPADVRLVEAQTEAFVSSGSDYRTLVRSLLSEPAYRAIR